MKRLLLMCAVLAMAAYVGCKQSEGERCQVDDDCESGTCNVAKGTCSGRGVELGDIDASVPDAPFDGPVDAPIDAPADAPPDAPDDPPE